MIPNFATKLTAAFVLIMMEASPLSCTLPCLMANEVIEETRTRVLVREHPKTGKPFVSIVRSDFQKDASTLQDAVPTARPDYRMLDPKVNAQDIPYDGPVSDRRKVYLFAGTLAALGAGAGVLGALAPAAASSGGAAGGGGLYAGAAALTGGGTVAATITAHADDQPEDFKISAESKDGTPQQASS